jgi:hypothetical protein
MPLGLNRALPTARWALHLQDHPPLSQKKRDALLGRLFDNFVGACYQSRGHGYAERIGRLEVNHQFKFRRLFNRDVAWLHAAQELHKLLGR